MTWTVRLSDAASNDFAGIVRWTTEHFGEHQAHVYAEVLTSAIQELSAGPHPLGVSVREDVGKGIHLLHVARHGHKGRHFVMFRVADSGSQVIDVIRLLHDSMDLPRYAPAK